MRGAAGVCGTGEIHNLDFSQSRLTKNFKKQLTSARSYAIFCGNLTGVYLAKNTGTTPAGVKAIRTAGSTADWRVTALLIELKAQIL